MSRQRPGVDWTAFWRMCSLCPRSTDPDESRLLCCAIVLRYAGAVRHSFTVYSTATGSCSRWQSGRSTIVRTVAGILNPTKTFELKKRFTGRIFVRPVFDCALPSRGFGSQRDAQKWRWMLGVVENRLTSPMVSREKRHTNESLPHRRRPNSTAYRARSIWRRLMPAPFADVLEASRCRGESI